MKPRSCGPVLAGFAGLLLVVYLGSILAQPGLPDPLWVVLIELTALCGFVLLLLYVARRIPRERFSPVQCRAIMLTIGGSVLLADGLILAYLGFLTLEGIPLPVEESVDVLLFGAAWGSGSGSLIGLHRARAQRSIDQAEHQRDELAFLNSVLRHNVLNGINLIEGNASLLAESADGPDQERCRVITERSAEIADLIQQIEKVVDLRTSELDTTSVQLSDLLSEAVGNARGSFPDATFEADIEAGVSIQGSPLLRAAFDNLLTNAVEHNDAATPVVRVALHADGDDVTVEVRDNGPGLPDDVEELFEKAHYSDTFGLYMVQTIVTEIGGEIYTHQNDSRGTVIRCEFPRAAPRRTPTPDREIIPALT